MRFLIKGQKLETLGGSQDLAPITAEIFRLYFYSCNEPKFVRLLSPTSIEILKNHLRQAVGFGKFRTMDMTTPEKRKFDQDLNPEKHVITLTGGKDSFFQLHKTAQETKPENILCLYVENLNKSECVYEKKSIKKICQHYGVKYKIMRLTNSIKINRQSHNIGLREQLVFVVCLPEILKFKAKNIHYGVHQGGYHGFQENKKASFSNMYTGTKHCWDLFFQLTKQYGLPDIELRAHPHEDDFETIEAIMNDDDIFKVLPLSSSCYTQINFRERHHQNLQKKFKTIKLSNGCGHCIKCVRINSGILLRELKRETVSPKEARFLFTHLKKKFRDHGAEDKTVLKYIGLIAPQIEKYRLSH